MSSNTSGLSVEQLLEKQPLLLFDGECGFCNHVILFFLRHERKPGKVNFISLQSEAGIALRKHFKIDDSIDSIILIRKHDAFIKTCAALRLTQYLKSLWPLLTIFLIIPPFLRNPFYDLVAKYRRKIVGRVQQCALLKEQDQQRFFS